MINWLPQQYLLEHSEEGGVLMAPSPEYNLMRDTEMLCSMRNSSGNCGTE
jgi:hypothetical protein